MTISSRFTVLSATLALALSSCQTANPYTGQAQRSKALTGSVIGGLVGAGIGALSGNDSRDRRQKAMVGAGIGILAGGGIGAYMDKQEAELRRELEGTGVGISRNGNQIALVMPGDITFSTASATISGQFYPSLDSVAKVLSKYDQTMVDITGHTDSVGQRDYNYRLSQSRANSVAGFLQSRKVNSTRFRVTGQGPDSPVATNGSEAGRQANRRVAIQLAPLT